MIFRAVLFLAAFFSASAGVAAPARIVSLNFCTDQLALLLARPGQLLSVTWIAHDPARNPLAARAQGLDSNRGEAEEILALKPDLVLAGTLTTRMTVTALRRLGVTVMELPPMQSLADLRAQTKAVAIALGNEEAADDLLAALPTETKPGATAPRALMIGPAGSIAGSNGLAGDVLRAAGYANIAERLPPRPWTNLTIEEILVLRPDVIIASDEDGAAASLAQDLLRHPALRRTAAFRTVPPGASSCAAPTVAAVLKSLQQERASP